MTAVISLFRSLQGVWNFRRTISPRANGHGKAIFTPHPTNQTILCYKETGKLILNGIEYDSTRNYTYSYEDGIIKIYLEDGQLLHALQFTKEDEAVGEHLCKCIQDPGYDSYKATFTFAKNRFELQYNITGPKKMYNINTVFEKT